MLESIKVSDAKEHWFLCTGDREGHLGVKHPERGDWERALLCRNGNLFDPGLLALFTCMRGVHCREASRRATRPHLVWHQCAHCRLWGHCKGASATVLSSHSGCPCCLVLTRYFRGKLFAFEHAFIPDVPGAKHALLTVISSTEPDKSRVRQAASIWGAGDGCAAELMGPGSGCVCRGPAG